MKQFAQVALVGAAILTGAATVWAQKVDFSGTWTLDPASATAGESGDGGVLGNGPAKVTQTAETLTIQRSMGADTVTLTYKLDGTGSRSILPTDDGQQLDAFSTAKWEGPSLSIVTKSEADGKLRESTEVWTLNGNTLMVVTGGGATAQKKHLYKR